MCNRNLSSDIMKLYLFKGAYHAFMMVQQLLKVIYIYTDILIINIKYIHNVLSEGINLYSAHILEFKLYSLCNKLDKI